MNGYIYRHLTSLFVATAIVTASGCSSLNTGADYRPIVDGSNLANYEQDLAACQSLARQRKHLNDETKEEALIGAVTGAVIGAASSGSDAVGGAVAGGIIGTAGGALEARTERKNIVIQCMTKRGYQTVEPIDYNR